MIKRCPECNRTYSDESISFCLADGALLSAPYDTPREEPPPTETLPSSSAPIPPTAAPKETVPTMTGLGGAGVSPFEAEQPQPERRQSSPLIWAAIAFVIVGAIVIGIFGVRRVLNRQTEPAAASSPEVLADNAPALNSNSANPTSLSVSTPGSPSNGIGSRPETKPTPSPQTEAKLPTPAPATAQADPVLVPPDSRHTSETKPTPATDYSRVFAQREVDSKALLTERPKPSYTDSARTNNVQGTVVLRVVLSADGSVGSISAVRGLPNGLTEQAIAAARRIRFVPAKKDGRPVSVAVTVEYNFSVY
jgi:TonB family protein